MPQFPQQWKSRPDTDAGRGDKAQRVNPTTDGAAAATEPVFNFDPDAVVRAIVFHVLDEKLAPEVTAESVRRTVSRLRRTNLRPAIRRSAWRAMSNPERLEWLLSESLTVPLLRPDDDAVSLEAREAR